MKRYGTQSPPMTWRFEQDRQTGLTSLIFFDFALYASFCLGFIRFFAY